MHLFRWSVNVQLRILVSNLFLAVLFWKSEFLIHEDSQDTGVWKYGGVYKILRYLSKNALYTKMLRMHLFSICTIKTPRALTALAPLDFCMVKTLTNVL